MGNTKMIAEVDVFSSACINCFMKLIIRSGLINLIHKVADFIDLCVDHILDFMWSFQSPDFTSDEGEYQNTGKF